MTQDQLEEMILDIISAADYDLAKSYRKDSAEEPDLVDEMMSELCSIARAHMEQTC